MYQLSLLKKSLRCKLPPAVMNKIRIKHLEPHSIQSCSSLLKNRRDDSGVVDIDYYDTNTYSIFFFLFLDSISNIIASSNNNYQNRF